MSNVFVDRCETLSIKIFEFTCKIYTPVRHWVGAAVFCIFVAMTVAVVHIFPLSNWDMFAYTAAVLEEDISDTDELHRQSYDFVERNVSAGQYLTLTQDREYRIRQAEDPDAFQTMLGFYRLKILYVETARILSTLTDPVKSLRLISLGSAIAVGAILLIWMARTGTLKYGPYVVALLVVSDFGETAQLLSPDLYATVFLLLAGLFYLEKLDIPAALSLVAAFLVRPDHLAFIGVFFVVAAAYGPGRWVMTACFAICFGIYVWLTRGADHPGWWIHMWFTHVEYVPTLEDFDPPFSIFAYLQMLVRSTVRSLMSETWLALLFAQLVILIKWLPPARLESRAKTLLIAVVLSIFAKYVVFPHFETRFYLPYLVLIGMTLLVGWHKDHTGLKNLASP